MSSFFRDVGFIVSILFWAAVFVGACAVVVVAGLFILIGPPLSLGCGVLAFSVESLGGILAFFACEKACGLR